VQARGLKAGPAALLRGVAGDDQAVPAAVRRAGRGRANGHAPPYAVEAFPAQVAMPARRRGAGRSGAGGML